MRKAVIDSQGVCINVIEVDGDLAEWDGHTLAPGDGNIGDMWTGSGWVRANVDPGQGS